MRLVRISGRLIVALAISLSLPLASANAASRAPTAIPSVASAATTSVGTANGSPQRVGKSSGRWPFYALAIIAAAALVFVLASGKDDDKKPVSRG